MRPLNVIGLLGAGASALAYVAYRKDLKAAKQRIFTGRQFVEKPSGPIEYAESGDGPAVLFVHGAGGGFDQGLALGAAFLGDGYRIVAPSRFGYLGSPVPADASPEAQADAYVPVLDALHLERVPVIGVSGGGPSAVQFALRHPDRCSGLVLVVPMAWAPERKAGDARISPMFLPLLNAVASSDFLYWTAMKTVPTALVQTLLGTPLPVYRKATAESRREIDQMLEMILPISMRVAGIWNDSEIATNLTRYALEEMTVPALVISATDDLYDTYDSGLYTAEQIPDAQFTGFSAGGHLLLGHEDEVRAEIGAFVQANLGVKAAMAV